MAEIIEFDAARAAATESMSEIEIILSAVHQAPHHHLLMIAFNSLRLAWVGWPTRREYAGEFSGGRMESLNRKKRLPVWVRTILALVLVIIGGGIWGFVAVAAGVPNMWVAIGAVVISAIVIVRMFGDENAHDSN